VPIDPQLVAGDLLLSGRCVNWRRPSGRAFLLVFNYAGHPPAATSEVWYQIP
jgi:hypothetical protein